MNKVFVFLLLLFFVPFVSADLVVSPINPSYSCVWYTHCVHNVSVTNTGNVSFFNLTFSPISNFAFPEAVDLLPNQSKSLSFDIYTNTLFANQVFVSTVSFFNVVNVSSLPKVFDVNVSSSGFSVFPVLMSGDSLSWHNTGSSVLTLNDLGSGFPSVSIPAHGVVNVSYSVVKSYNFFIVQSGVAGSFSVTNRSGSSFSHDSSFDKQVTFRLSSVLPASTMQVSLLTTDISVDNNVTYPEALIEVRNLDPNLVIRNVNVSSDRWTSSFSPNLFNLPAGGVQRILFNITPIVDKTNFTNRTNKIILSVKSDNAGSTVKDIDVFVKYHNFDVTTINGVNYTITVLGVNDTISACLQHMNDAGFEKCLDLKAYFTTNVTIIKEIPASYKFTESQIKSYSDSWSTLSGVAQRLENKQNSYLDKQSATNLRVDNLSSTLSDFQSYVNARELERDKVVQSHNLRFWLIFSFSVFFVLMYLVVALLSNLELFDSLERAGQ